LVPGASATDTIASGRAFTCAITTDGHVACWGKNAYGQLGHDTSEPFNPTPTLVTGLDEVVSIAAGMAHVCALRQSGQVWCWGDNSYGQLGDGTKTSRSVPVRVPTYHYRAFDRITAGQSHTCAVTEDGIVVCWGSNTAGQLGLASSWLQATVPTGTSVFNATNVMSGPSAMHTCAVLATGELKCWGYNSNGQCGGVGSGTGVEFTPVAVQLPTANVPYSTAPARQVGVASLALATTHTCMSTDAGNVFCWGDNSGGKVTATTASGPFYAPTIDYPQRRSFR